MIRSHFGSSSSRTLLKHILERVAGVMPPPLDDLHLLTAPTRVMPGVGMPLYAHVDGQPPHMFWWEQRVFLNLVGVDGREFRKQEARREIWNGIRKHFGLPHDAMGVPTSTDMLDRGPTPILSTASLLAWLQTRRYMAWRYNRADLAASYQRLLAGLFLDAASGHDLLIANDMELPTLSLLGSKLVLRASLRVDMRPIMSKWPELHGEWLAISAVAQAPFGALGGETLFDDAFSFVYLRSVHGGAQLPEGHWMLEFLSGMCSVVAYLIEAQLSFVTTSADTRAQPLRPVELLGKHQQRRQHRLAHSHLQILQAVRRHGSAEAIAHGISGIHGLGSLLQSTRVHLYAERSVQDMSDCTALCVHWDGSTHGGLDVSLGIAIRSDTQQMRYLRPQVVCGGKENMGYFS
jgi:hypothetical protein